MQHNRVPLTLLLAVLLGAPGCSRDEGPSFPEAVETVYKACDAEPIKLKAAEKGLQLAFEPCGSNNFVHFRWSPGGLNLYYQASQGGWVRKDTGENYPLRIGIPRGQPTWLNDEMLAYPDADGHKIGVYQVSAHILSLIELPHVEAEQLDKGRAADEILYLASETPGGVKDVYRLFANTGETERAFSWLGSAIEFFDYQPEQDILCYREMTSTEVVCAQGENGRDIHRVRGRKAGHVSSDGRYLVTEGDGKPIKSFPDSPEDRPDFIPEELIPPALWITELETGKEVLWEGVRGTRFQWYEAAPYFGSFLLWGFDERELNRNVTLGDLRNYLRGQGWDVPAPARILY